MQVIASYCRLMCDNFSAPYLLRICSVSTPYLLRIKMLRMVGFTRPIFDPIGTEQKRTWYGLDQEGLMKFAYPPILHYLRSKITINTKAYENNQANHGSNMPLHPDGLRHCRREV